MILPNLARNAIQWLFDSPQRALERAFAAALKISEIEQSYFQGQTVSRSATVYSNNTYAYFRGEVNRHLLAIRVGLAEFKTSRFFLSLSESAPNQNVVTNSSSLEYTNASERQNSLSAIEKLKFIDEIIDRYQNLSELSETSNNFVVNGSIDRTVPNVRDRLYLETNSNSERGSVSDSTNILPRSLLKTVDKIGRDISASSTEIETEVLNKYRSSRQKTVVSIRFLLLLILIPLITHQLSKTLIVSPLVKNYFQDRQDLIFLNQTFEEEALNDLHKFAENLRFQSLLGTAPELTKKKLEVEVKEKASEIAEEYRWLGLNAIGNIFADILSLIVFGIFIYKSQTEIAIVKSFFDELFYGLSDSAKAFLIIIISDTFVGFHSPHGWEVILEGIAKHLGVPENKAFNGLFISTFPVILDTILKYWIFRYLNRLSPSAVVTYKNMNE